MKVGITKSFWHLYRLCLQYNYSVVHCPLTIHMINILKHIKLDYTSRPVSFYKYKILLFGKYSPNCCGFYKIKAHILSGT